MIKRTLEHRIARLEKLIFNERKQVGTLYHICDAKSFIKYVLPKDQLKSSGEYTNYLYGGHEWISFTRSKYYTLEHDLSQYSGVFIRLVVDGDRLSDKYKVRAYNDTQFDRDTGGFLDADSGEDVPEFREQEEAVKGPISNISKYIKEIQLDVSDLKDPTLKALKSVATKLKSFNVDVVYNNFMKRNQSSTVRSIIKKLGLMDGDDLDTIVSTLKKATKLNPEPLLFSGDINKIKKALDEGADINEEYEKGYILTYYCNRDNYDIIKFLIDDGADLDVGRGRFSTPLIAASRYASPEVVQLLLKSGADVNAVSNDGSTPIFAARNNDSDPIAVAKLLIKAGADVNHVNKYGMTPLKLASGPNGNKEMAQLLIRAGAVD